MMRGTKIEEYVVIDWDLQRRIFENFELAIAAAIDLSSTERSVFITLPDGRRFSILECPKPMR